MVWGNGELNEGEVDDIHFAAPLNPLMVDVRLSERQSISPKKKK
ncbi:hypothetical protein QUF81_18940 [Peribacillus simplex]|uniref:Uncharacterized protein n=1 Tax=Peribacillus simplex TaxID=1478 RepID=A0AAW7IVG2_9BACI|nr:hypothetical protein [Peribacillus simplex]MDM5295203.1 hypothetical protein [Peribacillus simplex]MDM5454167.1 hypothetical protein [Peribacillus simplex]